MKNVKLGGLALATLLVAIAPKTYANEYERLNAYCTINTAEYTIQSCLGEYDAIRKKVEGLLPRVYTTIEKKFPVEGERLSFMRVLNKKVDSLIANSLNTDKFVYEIVHISIENYIAKHESSIPDIECTLLGDCDTKVDSSVETSSASSTTKSPVTRGLVGQYTFDNCDNLGEDFSSYGDDASVVGYSIKCIPGVAGKAAKFNGDKSHMLFAGTRLNDQISGKKNFAVSFFLKANPETTAKAVMSKRQLCKGYNMFDIRTTTAVGFELWESEYPHIHNRAVIYDIGSQWNHIVYQRDGNKVEVYLNGDLVDQDRADQIMSVSDMVPFGINTTPCIGADGTKYFDGALDQLSVFSNPLTASEIKALGNPNSTPVIEDNTKYGMCNNKKVALEKICEVDLVNNTTTCESRGDFTSLLSLSNGQALAKMDIAGSQYSKAYFDMTFADTVTEFAYNIGDSATNNGWAGDAGSQSRDAEVHSWNKSMFVMGSDYTQAEETQDGHRTLFSQANTFDNNLEVCVGDQFVSAKGDNGTFINKYSPSLFALSNQEDNEGTVNGDIYLGMNRVIQTPYRVGKGLEKVVIYGAK